VVCQCGTVEGVHRLRLYPPTAQNALWPQQPHKYSKLSSFSWSTGLRQWLWKVSEFSEHFEKTPNFRCSYRGRVGGRWAFLKRTSAATEYFVSINNSIRYTAMLCPSLPSCGQLDQFQDSHSAWVFRNEYKLLDAQHRARLWRSSWSRHPIPLSTISNPPNVSRILFLLHSICRKPRTH
jgi:hypothetical protein